MSSEAVKMAAQSLAKKLRLSFKVNFSALRWGRYFRQRVQWSDGITATPNQERIDKTNQ
jgi:hypothetical protein